MEVDIRYVGFEIPNRFVIGYGLDFAERYRNCPMWACCMTISCRKVSEPILVGK